jgi:transcriptional regulator with XRE-family HTH domain
MYYGDHIKAWREVRGLKQKEVSGRLNISVDAYGKIEHNATHLSFHHAVLLSKLFGITLEQIASLPEDFRHTLQTNPDKE